MSEETSRPTDTAPAGNAAQEIGDSDPIERRESRREKRGKNTLILRELAIIAALGLVILAFNLQWRNVEGDRDVAAQQQDDIRLRDVRTTPPEPEPPEPEPEPQPQPEPEVPENVPREEVPDEQVEDEPEVTAEPMQELDTSPTQETSEPAPQSSPAPAPQPEPPQNKVFSQGTTDRNAQMQGRLQPEYPEGAKQAGIEGTVIVQFVVDESGRAQDIEVLRSPNDLLAEAAVDALGEVSFEPARQNGEPVKMRMSQPVTFRLD